MALSASQLATIQKIKQDIADLPSEGQAAVAKAAQFGARFQWFYVALASAASLLIGVWIGAHL